LHLLLVPLFALMGVALYLLLQGVQNRAATLSRYATVVYISFTIGYDMAVGLTSGIFVSNVITLPNAQQAVVQQAMHQFFASPAITLSYFILLGSGIVSICAAAWALSRAGVPNGKLGLRYNIHFCHIYHLCNSYFHILCIFIFALIFLYIRLTLHRRNHIAYFTSTGNGTGTPISCARSGF